MSTKKSAKTVRTQRARKVALEKVIARPGVWDVIAVYEASRRWAQPLAAYYNFEHPSVQSTVSSSSELILS